MSLEILLVEPDAALAEALGSALTGFGHHVTLAGDAAGALVAVAHAAFDALVIERLLPGTDGIAIVRKLRADGVTIPIVLHTVLDSLSEKLEGLASGADDYVVKPIDSLELSARLAALRRGRGYAVGGGDTLRAGDIVVSPAAHRAWRADVPLDLSKIELGILTELARQAGAVVSRTALYDRLWGTDFRPATNLAEAHVRRLRLKLTADGGDDPIATVRGVGYRLRV
jgi:two-component system, OmpR family, response regulator